MDLVAIGSSWAALFAAYVLFSEQVSAPELIAGAVFAVAGAAVMEGVRRHSRRRFAIRPAWLLGVARSQLPAALTECAALLRAFAQPESRRGRCVGRLVALPFDGRTARSEAEAAGRRALVTTALTFSPNSVAVEIEMEPGRLLLHQLEPRPAPEGYDAERWPLPGMAG